MKHIETLEVWECPECAFTFDACHTDSDGGYSCPHCAEIRLERENERLQTMLDASNTQWKLFEQKYREAVEVVTEYGGLKQELERVKKDCSELVWAIRPGETHYDMLKEYKLAVVRENEELKTKIESIQSDYQRMYERCLQQHNDIDFWKRENSQSRAQYNGLLQEVRDLQAEKEQLQELWNVAYDLGVRAEIDPVTGEISRRWFEPKNADSRKIVRLPNGWLISTANDTLYVSKDHGDTWGEFIR